MHGLWRLIIPTIQRAIILLSRDSTIAPEYSD
jgi:hypothetical protein